MKRLAIFFVTLGTLVAFGGFTLPQIASAAVSKGDLRGTINAKCDPVLSRYSNKNANDYKLLKQSCDIPNNPSEHQLAGRLLAICQKKDILTHNSVGRNYYKNGGSIQGGDCDKIKTNQEILDMADTETTGNPTPAKASGVPATTDPALDRCKEGNCLVRNYINPIIKFLVALVGLVVVVAIIIGGIRYAASDGDPQKAAAGKSQIKGAIIALVCFMLLYAALNWLIPGGVG